MWKTFVPSCLRGREDLHTLKNSDDTDLAQGSRSRDVHYYYSGGELGHRDTNDIRLGTMASCSSERRREDDVVPILEELSEDRLGGRFYEGGG